MRGGGFVSRLLFRLAYRGFSVGSVEFQEEFVERTPYCLTEHVSASLDGFMNLTCAIYPAEASVEIALHLKRDNRHFHAHYVHVIRFEIKRVSPIPFSHFDL